MDKIKVLSIYFNDRLIGKMALHQNSYAAFEYDSEWISDGFSISPYSLPL